MRLPALPFLRSRFAWLLGAASSARTCWLAVICLVTAALVLTGATWQSWALRAALAERQHRLLAREAVPSARPAQATAAAGATLSAAERTRVNLIVRRLNTPWGAILDALEAESSAAVTILAIEPDVERGAIRIHSEGRQVDDLLAHAGRLMRNPQFAQVQLLRIDTDEASPQRLPRLTFDLVLAP